MSLFAIIKKITLSIILVGLAAPLFSQDLLNELNQSEKKEKEYTIATFKGTRIINGHSVETKGAGELEFIISHRFGAINSGSYNLFGLDQAYIRLGFEYGITDRLGVGVGRSSFNKIYDAYLKYKLVRQSNSGSPVTITTFGSIGLQTSPEVSPDPTFVFTDRLNYTAQILIARKFSSRFSAQISPTIIHMNRTDKTLFNNDQAAMGIGARYKLTRSLALNAEYYYRISPVTNTIYYNSVGVGLDIETGGHVFQLVFSNSQGMIERTLHQRKHRQLF